MIGMARDTVTACGSCEKLLAEASRRLVDGMRVTRGLLPNVWEEWWT